MSVLVHLYCNTTCALHLEVTRPSAHPKSMIALMTDDGNVRDGGMQSALYSCALDGDAGPVAAGGAIPGCTSANLPDGYVVEETREISEAKKQHVQ